ncbi:MAG: AraC family transcriptional regulator [Bacteroidota bacterium]
MNKQNILTIKNMVCPRCIKVVREELEKLGLTVESIMLGSVTVKEEIGHELKSRISKIMLASGFELLEDKKARLIDQIKIEIIKLVQNFEKVELESLNVSDYLSQKLQIEYSSISTLFSKTEGITIEHFFILQKVEKVKELLRYDELTLSEIAYKLGYSSVQHLSNQFKKNTGMTASQFRKESDYLRKSIDSITK